VLILVWVYYSAQIFFFGAEFTYVYAHKHGSRFRAKLSPGPKPPENPVRVTPAGPAAPPEQGPLISEH